MIPGERKTTSSSMLSRYSSPITVFTLFFFVNSSASPESSFLSRITSLQSSFIRSFASGRFETPKPKIPTVFPLTSSEREFMLLSIFLLLSSQNYILLYLLYNFFQFFAIEYLKKITFLLTNSFFCAII